MSAFNTNDGAFAHMDAGYLDSWASDTRLDHRQDFEHAENLGTQRDSIARQMAAQMYQVRDGFVTYVMDDGALVTFCKNQALFNVHRLSAPLFTFFAFWGADVSPGVDFDATIAAEVLDDDTGILDEEQWQKRALYALKLISDYTKDVLYATAQKRLVEYFLSYIPDDVRSIYDLTLIAKSDAFQNYMRRAQDQQDLYPKSS